MMTGWSRLVAVLFAYGLPLLLNGVRVAPALAQGIPSQAPLPPGTGSAAGGGGALVVIGTFVALLVIVGTIAKLHGMRQRRAEEGLTLQSRLGDVLLMDPLLVSAAVVPTVHVPLWRGSPLRVEVSGSVPSQEMRERIIHVMRQEAIRLTRYAQDVKIEDRVSVLPPVAVPPAA
jgi:hypothetical protein